MRLLVFQESHSCKLPYLARIVSGDPHGRILFAGRDSRFCGQSVDCHGVRPAKMIVFGKKMVAFWTVHRFSSFGPFKPMGGVYRYNSSVDAPNRTPQTGSAGIAETWRPHFDAQVENAGFAPQRARPEKRRRNIAGKPHRTVGVVTDFVRLYKSRVIRHSGLRMVNAMRLLAG
jgi:hypothetical protein